MKNLKKLVRTELKNVQGGNAPQCGEGQIACHHKGENGSPSYWSCEWAETYCKV